MVEKPTYEELEERYRSFVEHFQGIAYRGTMDFIPIFFHGAVVEITGYTEDEFLAGKPGWDQIIHPEDLPALFTEEEKKLHTIPNYEYDREYRIIRKDETIRWLHESIQNVCDASGRPAILQGAIYDITDRKRTEKALRDSEEKYRAIVEDQTEMICRFKPDCTLTFVNESYARNWNKTPDEMSGMNFLALIPNSEHETLKGHFNTFSPENDIQLNEHQFIRENGAIGWQQWSNRAFFADDGTLKEFQSVGRDITERKRTEEALRESEEKYRAIFENSVVGFFQSTPEGRFINVNSAFARMLGFDSPEELIESISDIATQHYFDPEDRHQYQQILHEKGTVENFEFKAKNKDGTWTWVSDSTRAFFNADGEIIRYEGIVVDISERKRAEEEKEKLQLQLLQAQKIEALGNLAGGIAHDFNNILSAIIGYTELAIDEVEKGTALEDDLKQVFKAGRRARDLVKQILTFARQSDEEIKPIQIDMMTKEALKLIRSTIPTDIEIKQMIKSNSLIMGNSSQLNQVFMNLFTNAAHAMEEAGGILEVGISDIEIKEPHPRAPSGLKSGEYVMITVSDTGTGIRPDILDSIFEPYFTTKDIGEGTGMGLAIVHGIVEGYGGKISVESEIGQGTRFSIYLPISKKRGDYQVLEEKQLPSGNERVLFVDDEVTLASMNGQMLERLGYQVTVRSSSLEALELFRAKPDDFDLVITDMAMPYMTGDRLAAALMAIRPDIPVILCTGYSKRITALSTKTIGIKAFELKPLVKAQLAKTVRKVLDEAQAPTQN